ncbi:cbb3-type cytochrome c oxidase subunit 3 [Qipengyuania sp.]|uniref:cbb3-type cytochrome c oxidase subunit 3 n=1 Tax=Qipengyuania sp. TaxID=2004515 RepID=UPI0035C7AF53
MSFYEQLRHFADSHFLLLMFGIFLTLALWPFRPGGKRHADAAATMIFEDDNDGR